MNSINIGVLLPSSTIFPISKNFEKGLNEGIKKASEQGVKVEIVKEFVGQGSIKQTEEACAKFFTYDDVDVVTGFISNRVAEVISEKFKKRKIPLIVNNLGAHVPKIRELNDYIFINSPHLWRHAWAIGNWGVENFGKKGMFVGGVYDAGYDFPHLFHEGMKAADMDSFWSFSVTPMPEPGCLSDMSPIFPFLEKYTPDFIFATFCGEESTLFLNEFIERGWHRRTKVLSLPYLLSPFSPLKDDLEIFSTAPFDDCPEIQARDVFFQLGLTAGNNISSMIAMSKQKEDFKMSLVKQNSMFNVESNTYSEHPQISIFKSTILKDASEFCHEPLLRWPGYKSDVEGLMQLTAETGTGWYNPYLCI